MRTIVRIGLSGCDPRGWGRLRLPFRTVSLALTDTAVRDVLSADPARMAPANAEKIGALARFQPGGVLISSAEQRPLRREFTTAVLETDRPVHSVADHLVRAVTEEAAVIAGADRLTWPAFETGWWRLVRRIVLGDSARDDSATTDLLRRLRRDGNWGPFHPARPAVRAEFLRRLRGHLDRAESGSLAARAAQAGPDVDPVQQVPQWLFAFDAAGIAAYRTLALLATHTDADVRADADTGELPFLRACVQEAVRLWPTTPAILRDDHGRDGEMVVIYTPFFHRDETRLAYAHEFTPDVWLDGRGYASWSLVPFSAGPAQCPGRNLVLLTTSTLVAVLRSRHRFTPVTRQRLEPGRRLPGSFDHVGLSFVVTPR